MWETWKAHHKTCNTYFKFEPLSVTQSQQCTSLVGDFDSFGGRLAKVFATIHIGNNDTMACETHGTCETHGIHSTLHNGMDRNHVNGWIEK